MHYSNQILGLIDLALLLLNACYGAFAQTEKDYGGMTIAAIAMCFCASAWATR